MIGNSLLSQVLIAGIAVGIVITFIQPKLGDIRTRQDEIAQTRSELEKITEANAKLSELYSRVNAIPQRDKAALFTYLPDYIDEVQVLKDLSAMSEDIRVSLTEIQYVGSSESSIALVEEEAGPTEKPFAHSFNLGFTGSYEQTKDMLTVLERNNYPLVVKVMNAEPTDGGLLNVTMELVTYSHKFKEIE
jgi:hypothetical protein